MTQVYLKPSVKIEPLVCKWYAWPHLIYPFSLGANLAYRYMKIMRSYIQNPQIHIQSVMNPKLVGGPFVNLEQENVSSVQALLDKTQTTCEDILNLNLSVKEFDTLLQNMAIGASLEDLYSQAPDILKGLFELVYDINNHPSIRLIEPLLYSKFYKNDHQSICISDTANDFRKFVLSTPRVEQDQELHCNLPFESSIVDNLSSMLEAPSNLNGLIDALQINPSQVELFKSFFTSEQPEMFLDRTYEGEGVRVRYFGHACILVQTNTINILIDPFIGYKTSNSAVERYTLSDLPPKIDYVLITHTHQDHMMLETLLRIRHKVSNIIVPRNNKGSIADPNLKLILRYCGFKSIMEIEEFDEISFSGGRMVALPFLGEHADLNIQSKLAFLIEAEGKKLMFAADSNNLNPALYDHIYDLFSNVDILFVGLECAGAPLSWLYGPLLTKAINREHDKTRRLSGSNADKAKEIVERLKCKYVYIYAMGREPWLNHIMALDPSEDTVQHKEAVKLIEYCNSKNIESEMLFGKYDRVF